MHVWIILRSTGPTRGGVSLPVSLADGGSDQVLYYRSLLVRALSAKMLMN